MKEKNFRVVIIPSAATLIEMKEKVMKTKGIDLANVLYKLGESAGSDFFEHCIMEVKGRRNKIKKMFEVLNSTDYGRYELVNISKDSIVIKLTQSPFTKLCLKNKKSSCYWILGLLTGLFNNIDKEFSFERKKCKILGHRHCEFKGKIII